MHIYSCSVPLAMQLGPSSALGVNSTLCLVSCPGKEVQELLGQSPFNVTRLQRLVPCELYAIHKAKSVHISSHLIPDSNLKQYVGSPPCTCSQE